MNGPSVLLACVLLAVGTSRQETEPEPSIAEELAALIERTNAYESFHCVWLGEEEDQRLELAYEAPGKGRVSLVISDEREETRFDEECFYFRDEEDTWRFCRLPSSEPRRKLDELFPSGQRLGPGFEFFVGGSVGHTAWYKPDGRDALFSWLAMMQQESEVESVVREDDVLVWTRPIGEWRVARDTGFPQQIREKTSAGTRELRLAQCTTDETPVPLEPPAAAEHAIDDDIHRILIEMWDLPSIVRSDAFDRVEAQLASGTRTWDARTRADWDEFLVALHGPNVEWPLVDWIKELLAYINEALDSARAILEEDDTPGVRATLVQHFDDLEQSLAPGFEQAPLNYLASLEELEDVRDELIEAEHEAILRLHDELITQPILEFLAEGREMILGE